ncbi:MAG: response regulator [Bacteroidia bacterium]
MIISDKNGKVILVDDDPINNLVTKRLLQKINPTLEIMDFTNAHEALEHLKSSRIDLILLDINMPGMNGWEFLNELENSGNKTPVLMLSSSIDPNDHCKSINYKSVRGFLRKPLMN